MLSSSTDVAKIEIMNLLCILNFLNLVVKIGNSLRHELNLLYVTGLKVLIQKYLKKHDDIVDLNIPRSKK